MQGIDALGYEEVMTFLRSTPANLFFKDTECRYLFISDVRTFFPYGEGQEEDVLEGKIIGIVGLIGDITERVRLEKQAENWAVHDDLTGLYNRNYLKVKGAERQGEHRAHEDGQRTGSDQQKQHSHLLRLTGSHF